MTTYVLGTGFETGSSGQIPHIQRVAQVVASYHTGAYCLQVYDSFGDSSAGWDISPSLTELWVGLWIKTSSVTDLRFRFKLTDGKYLEIRCYTLSALMAYVDGVLVATGTGRNCSGDGVWYNLQLHIKVDDTVGKIEGLVEGLASLSYTGDTKPSAATNIELFEILMHIGTSLFDDLIIANDDWPGDVRFDALVPNADTATAQWTPSTGVDHYAMVDEVPPSDTDYNISDTNGQQDLLNLTDFAGTGKTPVCVVQWLRAAKNTANAQQIKLLLKSGATTVEGSANDLDTVYKYFTAFFANNPDDSAAWEDADLDALQIGYKSVI